MIFTPVSCAQRPAHCPYTCAGKLGPVPEITSVCAVVAVVVGV